MSPILQLHPEFLVGADSRPTSVLLPYAEWESLMERLEEIEDVAAIDQARVEQEPSRPFEEVVAEMQKKWT